jgi:hypothetical protein
MPEQSAQLLLKMFVTNDPAIKDLRIANVAIRQKGSLPSDLSTRSISDATQTASISLGRPSTLSKEDRASLERQLRDTRENLRLIEERKAEYVLGVEVPLQIIKEERRLRDKIADLETQLR